mgnify:CR=1 FL=1
MNRFRLVGGLLCVTLIWLCVMGCRDGVVRPDGALDPTAVPESAAADVLGPMDVLDIRVYDEPEISGEYRVDGDGTLSFPFVDPVAVHGLTPQQVAQSLRDALADGYLVNPVVNVVVKEINSRKIFVLGHVKKPGPYPYSDGMTIVEAIALAGGVASDGALNRTRLTRKVGGGEVNQTVQVSRIANGDEPNVLLQPSDIVFVPQAAI